MYVLHGNKGSFRARDRVTADVLNMKRTVAAELLRKQTHSLSPKYKITRNKQQCQSYLQKKRNQLLVTVC